MTRLLSIVALVAGSSLIASLAQAQGTYAPDPALRNPKGTVAPQNGTAEQAFIKEEIGKLGYTGVNSPVRDTDSSWHVLAYKGPLEVELAIDTAGRVHEMPKRP